jgi:hypothetical protein
VRAHRRFSPPPVERFVTSSLTLRGRRRAAHTGERRAEVAASMYGEPPSEERITELQENWLIPTGKLTVQSELGRGAFGVVRAPAPAPASAPNVPHASLP